MAKQKIRHKWTKGDTDTLLAMYADSFNYEIAHAIGCSVPTIDRRIKKLGLKEKSDIHKRRYSIRMSDTMKGRKTPWAKGRKKGYTPTPENIEAARQGLLRTYASERRRILFGLPQRTGLRVSIKKGR